MCHNVSAQKVTHYLKENSLSLSLTFAAGALNGLSEVLQFHYSSFNNVHPNANAQFWNPDLSWKNKYKGNDPTNGEKFYYSTSWLCCTTDGYHAVRMAERFAIVGAITIPLNKNIRQQKKFIDYALDFGTHWASYELGFYFTYNVMY